MTAKRLWKEQIGKGLKIWGHPNGKIYANIRLEDKDGKKTWLDRSLNTDSRGDARYEAIKLQALLQDRTERGQSVKKLYAHDYVDKFMAHKKQRVKDRKMSEGRLKLYVTTFGTWWGPWVTKHKVAIADVTEEYIKKYRTYREWYPESDQWADDLALKKKNKESTRGFAQMKTPGDTYLEQELKRIKEMFNWCVGQRVIDSSQIPIFPEIDASSETSEGFSYSEFEGIDNYMLKEWIPGMAGEPKRIYERERVHLKMNTLIDTGCRVADLSQLQWKDLRYYQNEKTGEGEYYYNAKAKVKKSRELSLEKSTYAALMKWKFKSKFRKDDDLVFGTQDSNKDTASIDAGLWKRLLLDVGHHYGVEMWLDRNGRRRTLTACRHTFATWGILGGIEIDDLVHRMRTSRKEFDETYMDDMPRHDAKRYSKSVRPDRAEVKEHESTATRPYKTLQPKPMKPVLPRNIMRYLVKEERSEKRLEWSEEYARKIVPKANKQ